MSDEEKEVLVQDACKAAFAHEFIQDLPNVSCPMPVPILLQDTHAQLGV